MTVERIPRHLRTGIERAIRHEIEGALITIHVEPDPKVEEAPCNSDCGWGWVMGGVGVGVSLSAPNHHLSWWRMQGGLESQYCADRLGLQR